MLYGLLFCKNSPYKSQEKLNKKYTLYKRYLQSKLKTLKNIKKQAANSLQWQCKLLIVLKSFN